MYFQVVVTPPSRPKLPNKTKVGSASTASEIVTINLAPFTPNVKVLFEDVPVNSTAIRQVIVRNPSVQNIEVNITKLPAEDRRVQFNWIKMTIAANSEEFLNIQWTPSKEGSWIDTISFEGVKRLKKDMQIVFKSRNTNKGAQLKRPGAKKSPIAVVLKRLKSPVKQYTCKKPLSSSNKENVLHISGIQKFSSPTSLTFNISDQGQFGRETYLIDKPKILENNAKSNYLIVNRSFSPKQCSTGKKTKNNRPTPEICSNLNNFSSASTETYVVESDLKNISSETYVKNVSDINLSAGTYVKTSVSDITEDSLERKSSNSCEDSLHLLRATEINSTTRPNYQISDSSIKRQLNLQSSGVKAALQANLWANQKLVDDRPNIFSSASRKRKSDTVFALSPIKKLIHSAETKTWSKIGVAKKVGKVAILKPSVKEMFKAQKEERQLIQRIQEKASTISHSTEHFLSSISALNSTSSALNPFVTTTYIYDPQWLDEQEACFKRWFNVLLVPHPELKTYSESVDVARIWQQCLRKDVTKPPTKEEASQQYHVTARLDALRKSAMELYQSEDVAVVLQKVWMYVAAGKLEIRRDRSVHQDIWLQYEITRLFLSYNSLWLRIGLETIFGSIKIPLRSNSDIIGLTLFIKDHVFKDDYLARKHKTTLSPKYCADIKKHILSKFLSFVFFLDQAKLRKLIPHDPCLFVKSGEFKESRDVLLHFAKEVIASIGDITRFLKPSRYILAYKQTYIHEFDYAVAYLAGDLRDGVRLARIMEIILLQEGLTEMMRVPAISRLQKIYNVKVSFNALEKAGFCIMEDITPADIVNGHKEKTLTLLWQIVNKFQLPRFTKAAVTIQEWFRSLIIVVKRKQLNRKLVGKHRAAKVIQMWFRKHLSTQLSFIERRHASATKIQSLYKMVKVRRTYLKLRQFAVFAQSKYRILAAKQRQLTAVIKLQAFVKGYLARKRFLSLRAAVMVVEKRYVAKRSMTDCRRYYKSLKSAVIFVEEKFLARKTRREFLRKKQAVVTIQLAVRAIKLRNDYLRLKNAAICLQSRFRANQTMKQQMKTYSDLKTAAVNIQKRFRAKQHMELCRANYLYKTECIIAIQRYFRSYLSTKLIRADYNNTRYVVVLIQRKFRANKVRKEYLRKHKAARTIQEHFKAHLNMSKQRLKFISLREAAVKIQSQFRTRKERSTYLTLKDSAVAIQRRFRANKLAEETSNDYKKLKNTVVYIQRLYRANQVMKNNRQQYQHAKHASLVIQRRFRATMLMREQRLSFLQAVFSAGVIQSYYRSYKVTVKVREEFCKLRESTMNVQSRFRANRLMKLQRCDYLKLLEAAGNIQRRFRAQLEMREARSHYMALKKIVEDLQSRFRARKAMQSQRTEFLTLKQSVVVTQRRYRATILMRQQRSCYKHVLSCVVAIQRCYRSYRLTQKIRNDFWQLKKSVIQMQRRFRANETMKKHRFEYLRLSQAVKVLQRRFRAKIKMCEARNYYVSLRNITGRIQAKFRATKAMRLQVEQYKHICQCVVLIQRKFIATTLMRQQRDEYLRIKSSVVKLQRYYRSYKLTLQTKFEFNQLRKVVIGVQRRFRANELMKQQRDEYRELLESAKIIQRRFRAQLKMREERSYYMAIKKSVDTLQSRFRSRKTMRSQRTAFLTLKQSVVVTQRRYRAIILMHQQKNCYKYVLSCVVTIQRYYRSCRVMRSVRNDFCQLKNSVVNSQRRFRAKELMKKQRSDYLKLLQCVKCVQEKFRGLLKMRFDKQQFVDKRNAAIKLQNYYRSRKINIDYCRLRKSVVTIQRYFRACAMMKKQRLEYLKLVNAVRIIQRRYRALIKMREDRDYYNRLMVVAKNLQGRYRAAKSMKSHREQFLRLRQACLLIQRRFRSIKLMRCERLNKLRLKKAVLYVEAKILGRKQQQNYQLLRGTIIGVQTFFRGYVARQKYDYIFIEEYREHRREEIRKVAAVRRIQALWRGFKVRSGKSDEVQKIQRARRERKGANKAVILAEKQQESLLGIVRFRCDILKIINALKDLNFIARHSKECCESLCALLPDEIYATIKICTRSISDTEAIEHATRLLITLYKFSPHQNTYQPQHLDRMLALMSHFCDKEGHVFLNLATLFWLFAQDKKRRRDIQAVANLRLRLCKIKELTERKLKMVVTSALSLRQSVFVEDTSRGVYLPYLYPDWGLNYPHRPHAFTNIKHALHTLLDTLGH